MQVFAVAISANTGGPNSEFDGPEVGKRIEQAMANAVLWCHGEGITDVEVIKSKMQVARENVLRDARQGVTPKGN